jgi:hypothetical protein
MVSDYIKSNEINEIKRKRFALSYGKQIMECGDGCNERCKCSQMLINYLCEVFNIKDVKVVVHNSKRRLKGHGEVYGFYDYHNIHIYNKTARRGDIVSIKSYFDTLLHEFIHHYDVCYLGIKTTPHTNGFYNRLKDLKEKIIK